MSLKSSDIQKLGNIPNPFKHDLGIRIIQNKKIDAPIMICCHGYGHSSQIVDVINEKNIFSDHLVGFNFPDYEIADGSDHSKAVFGIIYELLPLLYVIKSVVIDLDQDVVNLYGFSAGGGAIVNALAVLNQIKYDDKLASLGISQTHKKKMIDAIQAGKVILDCPLKSMEEIVALRGWTTNFDIIARNYAENMMRPIDAIEKLKGLRLNIIVHFQDPDDVLSNRDDQLFIERLKKVNSGSTYAVIGHDEGHFILEPTLMKLLD